MNHKVSLIFLIIISFFRCGFVSAEVYTDDLGREVEIKIPPKRIISLAPSITEILFALGLEEDVVGVTLFSDYPEESKRKAVVGSYVNINLEKIVSLTPDLIISTSDGNPKGDINRLSSMGLPVFVISPPKGLEGIIGSIISIGNITMKGAEANELVKEMRKRIERVKFKLKGSKVRSVFYQLGDNPLMTAGGGTFISSLIKMAGGKNIFADSKIRYPRISIEKVLTSSPEVIIISSMSEKSVSETTQKKWGKWNEIRAVRNGEIHFINPDLIHRAGPRIVEGLEELAKMIHPERFPQ